LILDRKPSEVSPAATKAKYQMIRAMLSFLQPKLHRIDGAFVSRLALQAARLHSLSPARSSLNQSASRGGRTILDSLGALTERCLSKIAHFIQMVTMFCASAACHGSSSCKSETMCHSFAGSAWGQSQYSKGCELINWVLPCPLHPKCENPQLSQPLPGAKQQTFSRSGRFF
jgi:hypothetical protein